MRILYKFLPLFVFASYPLLIVYTFFWHGDLFLKVLSVPAGVFVLVTVLRKIIKEERPYVRYGVASVFDKDAKPDSMPSRHTASAFIIALAMLSVNITAGIVYLIIALLISVSRLCAGVHYIKDVLAGAAIAIACGIIFIFVI